MRDTEMVSRFSIHPGMSRNSPLNAAMFCGLLFIGGFILWLVCGSAGPSNRNAEQPVRSDAVQSGTDRTEKVSRIPSKKDFSSASNPIRDGLEAIIAEVEHGMNDASFDLREAKLREFVEKLSTNDFNLAFGALCEFQASQPTAAGRVLQLRLLERWAEFDAYAAAQHLDQVDAENRPTASGCLASVWARQNLSEAASWAQQLGDERDRQRALLGVASEAATKDPKLTLVLASQIPTFPADQHGIITLAASSWAAEAPDDAIEWAMLIQNQAIRQEVLDVIAITMADKDPADAARLVKSLPAGPEQEDAIFQIFQRLSLKDAEAANTWAAQFEGNESEVQLREPSLPQ
jgi:hypothetical protein